MQVTAEAEMYDFKKIILKYMHKTYSYIYMFLADIFIQGHSQKDDKHSSYNTFKTLGGVANRKLADGEPARLV